MWEEETHERKVGIQKRVGGPRLMHPQRHTSSSSLYTYCNLSQNLINTNRVPVVAVRLVGGRRCLRRPITEQGQRRHEFSCITAIFHRHISASTSPSLPFPPYRPLVSKWPRTTFSASPRVPATTPRTTLRSPSTHRSPSPSTHPAPPSTSASAFRITTVYLGIHLQRVPTLRRSLMRIIRISTAFAFALHQRTRTSRLQICSSEMTLIDRSAIGCRRASTPPWGLYAGGSTRG